MESVQLWLAQNSLVTLDSNDFWRGQQCRDEGKVEGSTRLLNSCRYPINARHAGNRTMAGKTNTDRLVSVLFIINLSVADWNIREPEMISSMKQLR